MKLFFLLLFLSTYSFAQSPWYFGTGEAVNLTNGTAYKNGVKTIAGSLDPSTTAVNAPSGSMYYSTSGTIYVKQDAGLSTNWLPLGIATTGTLSTLNGQSGPNVNIASGSSGTDFAVSAAANVITLNIPSASSLNRGLLTSSDWSDFDSKQDAITGAATTIVSSDLTANRAVISNGSGKIAVSSTTDTEIGYVSGVTSSIQTQLGGKSSGVASSVDSEIVLFSGTGGKTLKRASGTGYAYATSGVFSPVPLIPVGDLTGVLGFSNGGTGQALTADAGAVAYSDAGSLELTAPGTSGQFLMSNGTSAPSFQTLTKSSVGLSNVDNTSDASKPVSSATQAAIDAVIANAARLAGESYFAGTTGCVPSRSSTTVGAFGTDTDCPGPTIVRSELGSWQTTDSNLIRQTINSLPAGTYKAKFIFQAYTAASSFTAYAINDGTTTCEPTAGAESATDSAEVVIECSFDYASSGNRSFEIYGASSTSTITIQNQRTSPRTSVRFILEYWGNY